MASYNLTPHQLAQVAEMIANRSAYLAELIGKGIAANAQHLRPSSVTLAIKIARNKDEPRRIEVEVQEKIKAPRSRFSDLTSWDEAEVIAAFRVDQDPGQTVMQEAVGEQGQLQKTTEDAVVVEGLDNAASASAAADSAD